MDCNSETDILHVCCISGTSPNNVWDVSQQHSRSAPDLELERARKVFNSAITITLQTLLLQTLY